jgi:hypothetical protein
VQVDPVKPTLKPPVINRLKLRYDKLLPNFAYKFNLRRYNEVVSCVFRALGATVVGRCRLTLSNSRWNLEAHGTRRLKLQCGKTAFKFCFQNQLVPLHRGAPRLLAGLRRLRRRRQELTLVHFSAQPEPFLTQNTPLNTPNTQ